MRVWTLLWLWCKGACLLHVYVMLARLCAGLLQLCASFQHVFLRSDRGCRAKHSWTNERWIVPGRRWERALLKRYLAQPARMLLWYLHANGATPLHLDETHVCSHSCPTLELTCPKGTLNIYLRAQQAQYGQRSNRGMRTSACLHRPLHAPSTPCSHADTTTVTDVLGAGLESQER